MILEFKARVRDGAVTCPALRTTHIVSSRKGAFNALQFAMDLRRIYRKYPGLRPARTLRCAR